MCNFLSWVSVEGKLFYLTDQDVYSEAGKEKLAGCKDNDILGHGAIRKFYGLLSGLDCERQDFWADDLPKELKLKLKNFDKHWGRMWRSRVFQNNDLFYIIYSSRSPWKGKASEQLLRQNPTNDDLCCIICFAPSPWKGKAWEQLLKQKPTNSDIRYVVCNVPGRLWRERAYRKLLKSNPTNDDLRYTICFVHNSLEEMAWKQLLKQNPTSSDLQFLATYAPPPYKREAFRLLKMK